MKKPTFILLGFIILKFLLQLFFINSHYDLQRDEFLHLDQANHLALGYQSVPPLSSWIAYFIQHHGNSLFWIRFFPALFGALTLLVVWKIIKELRGTLYALVLGSTCILFSVLLRLNFLFQPNSFDVLSWSAFYLMLIRYYNRQESKWLYAAAIVFALGFLNKYNIAFLLIAILPAILVSKQRSVFKNKHLYFAGLLTILLISPNLYWQYQFDFPVLRHMQELAATQLIHVSRLTFLKEQLFYFLAAIPVIIAALYALLVYPAFKKYHFLFWNFLFTLALFVYFKAKGYYAIGLYPVYISFGAAFLGNFLQYGPKRYWKPILVAVPLLLYLLLFNYVYSVKKPEYIIRHQQAYARLGLLRWEDGRDHSLPQDFADMLGWRELASKVENAYQKIPSEGKTLVLCDNYGQAGAINFYIKNKNIRAVAFSADYIDWFDLTEETKNLIRVKTYSPSDDELKETSPYFERSFLADSITNAHAREFRTKIYVFIKAKVEINQHLKAEIEQARQ